ncbi:3'-5' exoribonuclease [Vibrio sp. SCSIO 43136]|uniref:3'-5' exoribonuclease domain-containing protein n=1 Tax=Vibrio sp. SCSIO 43136 TaxID=2819101 RepID=UPI002075A483|nr:3'-5' exoribonuclease [Vibrio sp. SCSIO 43136]USD68097.1 3'-5' exoribonuclease [Vibrio sp. SCSIO 43136]
MSQHIFENVTIDLETLDTTNNAKILSIGIVPFNWGECVSFEELCNRESSLYIKLDLESQFAIRSASSGTVEWWEQQGEAAQHVLEPSHDDVSLVDALQMVQDHLMKWVKPLKKDGGQAFCRGYDFDGGILDDAYEQANLKAPWSYNRFRCVRTVIDTLANTRNGYVSGKNPEGFIKHHALHDAAKDTSTMIGLDWDARIIEAKENAATQ